ncbi:hypothetical protein, partial [Nocardia beijingensis]
MLQYLACTGIEFALLRATAALMRRTNLLPTRNRALEFDSSPLSRIQLVDPGVQLKQSSYSGLLHFDRRALLQIEPTAFENLPFRVTQHAFSADALQLDSACLSSIQLVLPRIQALVAAGQLPSTHFTGALVFDEQALPGVEVSFEFELAALL